MERHKVPAITIHTDASFSGKQKVGAWACWIHGENLLIKKSGRIKEPIDDGNLCELIAIANALAILNRHRDIGRYELYIHTDSKVAIWLLKGERPTGKPHFNTVLAYTLGMLKQTKGYRFEHVKGHVWNGGHEEYSKPKYFINRWCDIAARKHMRAAAEEVGYEISKSAKVRRQTHPRGRKRAQHKPNPRRGKSPRTPVYKRAQFKVTAYGEHF